MAYRNQYQRKKIPTQMFIQEQQIHIPQPRVRLGKKVQSLSAIKQQRIQDHNRRRKKKMRNVRKVGREFQVAQQWVQNSNEYQRARQLRQEDHEGTQLIELKINDVRNAVEVFQDSHDEDCTPIVLVPKHNWFTNMFCIVPQGCFAICTYWGKVIGNPLKDEDKKMEKNIEVELEEGEEVEEKEEKFDLRTVPPGCLSPGIHFMPLGKRISHIVTQSSVPFDYPVKMSVTLDNVFVSIDTLIVFYITSPVKFIVSLGPYKLTDLLESFLEESIRSLARRSTFEEVYDLRGKNLESMVRDLNIKLKRFGVKVTQVNVTKIELPSDLQQSMANITMYESKESLREKDIAFETLKLKNSEGKKNQARVRENQILKKQANDYKKLQLVQKETDEIKAMTNKGIAKIESERAYLCEKIKLESELEEMRLLQESVNTVNISREEGRLKSESKKALEKKYEGEVKSKVNLDLAKNRAKCLLDVAKAEKKAGKLLEQKRGFEIRRKRLEILDGLSRNKDCIISGSSKYHPLSQLIGSEGNINAKSIMMSRQIKQ